MNTNTTTLTFFRVTNRAIADGGRIIAVPTEDVPTRDQIRNTNGVIREIGMEKWGALKATVLEGFNVATGRDNNPDLVAFNRITVGLPETKLWARPLTPKERAEREEARYAAETPLTMWMPEGTWVYDVDRARKVFVNPHGYVVSEVK